jgi:hypothetical protein
MPSLFSFYRAILFVLVAGALSVCSSMHDYTNRVPKNMTIKPDVRTGSARLHVYDVDIACNMSYQGTVELSGQKVNIGVAVGKLSYFDFNFSSSSIFTGRHSTSYGMYLTPRAGFHYDAAASYADDMYMNRIRTGAPGTRSRALCPRHSSKSMRVLNSADQSAQARNGPGREGRRGAIRDEIERGGEGWRASEAEPEQGIGIAGPSTP